MPFSSLQRDKNTILNALYVDKSGTMIVKQDLDVIFPTRYEESDLADIAGNVYVLGMFAIRVGNKYAVCNIPARILLHPTDMSTEKYQEESYYVLHFEKGSIFTSNMNVVKEETFAYYIYNYFIALGKVPWYLGPVDLLKIFSLTKEYTGKSYGQTPTIGEMIVSMIMRNSKNPLQYWRQQIKSLDDVYKSTPEYIPLRNVPFGARNTTAKLMGAYFDEGLNSALIYPSDKTERVEELLRQ